MNFLDRNVPFSPYPSRDAFSWSLYHRSYVRPKFNFSFIARSGTFLSQILSSMHPLEREPTKIWFSANLLLVSSAPSSSARDSRRSRARFLRTTPIAMRRLNQPTAKRMARRLARNRPPPQDLIQALPRFRIGRDQTNNRKKEYP